MVECNGLLRREFVLKFISKLFKNITLFFKRKFVQLFQNLGRAHGFNLRLPDSQASGKWTLDSSCLVLQFQDVSAPQAELFSELAGN